MTLMTRKKITNYKLLQTRCSQLLRNLQNGIQKNCQADGFGDINFGFMIGGDGQIFEGRGFDAVGGHTYGKEFLHLFTK